MGIAFSASSPFCHSKFFVRPSEVGQKAFGLAVEHQGARGYAHDQILPILAMLLFAAPVFASFRAQMLLMSEIDQRIELRVNPKDHASALAAISAGWAATGAIFLPEKGNAPSATVPGFGR